MPRPSKFETSHDMKAWGGSFCLWKPSCHLENPCIALTIDSSRDLLLSPSAIVAEHAGSHVRLPPSHFPCRQLGTSLIATEYEYGTLQTAGTGGTRVALDRSQSLIYINPAVRRL